MPRHGTAVVVISLVMPLWHLPGMAKTAVSIDDDVLTVSKQCATVNGETYPRMAHRPVGSHRMTRGTSTIAPVSGPAGSSGMT
jgi:hypothetical protein